MTTFPAAPTFFTKGGEMPSMNCVVFFKQLIHSCDDSCNNQADDDLLRNSWPILLPSGLIDVFIDESNPDMPMASVDGKTVPLLNVSAFFYNFITENDQDREAFPKNGNWRDLRPCNIDTRLRDIVSIQKHLLDGGVVLSIKVPHIYSRKTKKMAMKCNIDRMLYRLDDSIRSIRTSVESCVSLCNKDKDIDRVKNVLLVKYVKESFDVIIDYFERLEFIEINQAKRLEASLQKLIK